MYRGYKSKRAYLNAKIHALSHKIYEDTGAEEHLAELIGDIIAKRPQSSVDLFNETPGGNVSGKCGVSLLTDSEARSLYYELVSTLKKLKANTKATNAILGIKTSAMTDEQRRKIIKITRYVFGWSIEVTFSKILEFCPELAKRLTPWQIKQTKIVPLYNLLNARQANSIIKRLEKIEKRNKENG